MAAPRTYSDALNRVRADRGPEIERMTPTQLKRAFYRIAATADLRTGERDRAQEESRQLRRVLTQTQERADRAHRQLEAAVHKANRRSKDLEKANIALVKEKEKSETLDLVVENLRELDVAWEWEPEELRLPESDAEDED